MDTVYEFYTNNIVDCFILPSSVNDINKPILSEKIYQI